MVGPGLDGALRNHHRLAFVPALVILLLMLMARAGLAVDSSCGNSKTLPAQPLQNDLPNVIVNNGVCYVAIGKTSYYGNVNVLHGGELHFYETDDLQNSQTHFWAGSIIVENGGVLKAYAQQPVANQPVLPFGAHGSTLTIHLYGKDESRWNAATQRFDAQNKGAVCRSGPKDAYGTTLGPCGIPYNLWELSGMTQVELPGYDAQGKQVSDFFYRYAPLRGDGDCTRNDATGTCDVGYFGNKVLAVSYGGTLDLRGRKGATSDPIKDLDPENSGSSWMRLSDGSSLEAGRSTSLVLERQPDAGSANWRPGDEIVVTTTDYLPAHSEKLRIAPQYTGGATVPFVAVDSRTGMLQWPHNGKRYGGPTDTGKQWTTRLPKRITDTLDPELVTNGAETRAAVALLTRSIQIVSAGDKAGEDFPAPSTDASKASYSYGAHMVIRQGFKSVAIQGVEFRQMGQGGRLGHYPVHFHMARQTPANTYVKDSSINESMTRWIVLHSTLGVTVARNVGYKSIGHGFYLEDGTETDNKFHSNIGIFARAAVANVNLDTGQNVANRQNPRMVPGILADNTDPASFKAPDLENDPFIYRSDVENPSVFWITNGWNDFIGNMAAGAGTCGAAYWFVPAANADMIETSATHQHMQWSGYAGLQMPVRDANGLHPGRAGATPLKSFYKNYATSTMHSFQTSTDAPACEGVIAADAQPGVLPVLRAVNSPAPKPARHLLPPNAPRKDQHEEADTLNDHYYPHAVGARKPVRCASTPDGDDCSKVIEVCRHPPQDNCAVTVLDHFTSSFHWAHGNVSAIWLRPQWYLLTNSVVSDVQNGGVTFITGGDYTHSSVIGGYWGLAKSSVFIGNTQDNAANPYARNVGPFNGSSPLNCDSPKDKNQVPAYCLNADETISMPTSAFFTNQRLANIYDGPSYQDSNAYLDIKTAPCPQGDYNGDCMYGTKLSYLRLKNLPGAANSSCYLPNAAIAWKQPNGFFYPPAFHSRNLFFAEVDLRHYVIVPLFKVPDGVPPEKNFGQQGTYLTDDKAVMAQYCVETERGGDLFNSFSSIDRQTELNDDDGTLTGLSNSLPAGPLKQTISINDDSFFSAPVETPECGSALGDNAAARNACGAPAANKPPVTARTSPYDYVATMLYHREAPLAPGQDPNDPNRDRWGSVCTHQTCYGVPLYRQYLTKAEYQRWTDEKCSAQAQPPRQPRPECRWPFIRMSGENLSQRETLTINNGVYYVDTTVSLKTQKEENYTTTATGDGRSLNVFKASQTYYMFFAYAKTSTVQTYQIYVGNDFNPATGFKPGRMDIDGFAFLDKSSSAATETWAKAQKSADGILTVNIDFTGWTALDPASPGSDLCQPRTFCASQDDPKLPGKKMCVSALKPDDPLIAANKNFTAQNGNVCQAWAMKDLDCPPVVRQQNQWTDGGCFAFAFTLPPLGFAANDEYHRPDPQPFPTAPDPNKKQGLPDWTTRFTSGTTSSDACYYPKVPGMDCPVP